MAIRFDAAYNAEIRRVVRNFNQKRNRAIKRGFTHLPPLMTVSELKSRYTTRSDLNRELKLLEGFNKGKDEALKVIETSGGAKAIKWELDYLKANLRYAKEYYDREIRNAANLDTEMNITKREYVNNLIAKRDYLNLELMELNPSQFRTYRTTINEFLNSNARDLKSYRNWMSELEIIMRQLGYDNKTINKFFEGFETLTPKQFLTMYQQSAIVSRIYELYIPTRDGEFKLSTTEEDAKELIDTFMEEKDELIARAKAHDEMMNDEVLDSFQKQLDQLNEKKFAQKRAPLRKSRAEITKHDIEMIEALGGTIEDLLK